LTKRRAQAVSQIYVAGCERTWTITSSEADLAYTELKFSECPACPHRVVPDGGPSFCTLRPQTAAHPFAALAGFQVE
jgi:hypothetical protein